MQLILTEPTTTHISHIGQRKSGNSENYFLCVLIASLTSDMSDSSIWSKLTTSEKNVTDSSEHTHTHKWHIIF